MERKKWVKLDNASNIFLAARNDVDTKVFRLSAEIVDEIDPDRLQKALDKIYDQYVLYHSVLRRGIFWYYLEESDLRPKVMEEAQPPCSPIYHFDRKELLFRVLYYQNRIHLEVFHALSDGTGALWFFEDLITEYLALTYPEMSEDKDKREQEQLKEQLEDSFAHYFRKRRERNFAKAAPSALEDVSEKEQLGKKLSAKSDKVKTGKQRTYRIKGEKTPDNRTRVIELDLPLKEMLNLAHEQEVSLTIYLIALYFQAIYQSRKASEESPTIIISVPVNLRKMFPSMSARNFFSTIYLSYTFKKEQSHTIKEICEALSSQLKDQASLQSLERKLNRLIAFEFNPFIRAVFRPLKDLILKWINLAHNRGVTVAMSNLGGVKLPEPLSSYVRRVYFHTSAIRPQFCVISHQDWLTASFTTPFIETSIQEKFVQLLSKEGIAVTVGANKVTREELGEEAR